MLDARTQIVNKNAFRHMSNNTHVSYISALVVWFNKDEKKRQAKHENYRLRQLKQLTNYAHTYDNDTTRDISNANAF